MNPIIRAAAPTASVQKKPSTDPNTQDATTQAALDIGFLAFLARGYAGIEAELASTTDAGQRAKLEKQLQSIEDQFNQIQSLFHVDAQGNVTFDYDDGTGHGTTSVAIPQTDANATLLAGIQTMEKSYTGIATFLTFADSQTNNPLLAVFEWLQTINYTFVNDTNDVTRRDAIFFMLSLSGSPVGDLSGNLDQFLGFRTGAILQQTFVLAMTLCAVLANDSDIDLSAIEACLSINTKDANYQELESAFKAITSDPDWQQAFKGDEDAWLWFESRFWPFTMPGAETEHLFKANAVPLTKLIPQDKKDADNGFKDIPTIRNSPWPHRPN